MRITRRQANNINSERDSILHHLGTLQSQKAERDILLRELVDTASLSHPTEKK
jgi:hypothetical protein